MPGGDWTIETKDTSQVPLAGIDNKREKTVLLFVTKSCTLLRPQLIHADKSDRCLPKGVNFQDDWDITFTDSYWSTEKSINRHVDKIIVPYVHEIRENLPFDRINQKAIAIFDVLAAHRTKSLLEKLKANNIQPLYVPAACTDKLQPLDVGVNYDYKEHLKSCFHQWYAEKVFKSLDENRNDNAKVDLKTSSLKPINANWLISTHSKIALKCFSLKGHLSALGCNRSDSM